MDDPTMNFSTRFFLVMLQLAIGWHLAYEGYWKYQEKTWSSKGYLRNATGPLAPGIRWLAGDPEVTWQDSEGRSGFVVYEPSNDFLARFEVIALDPNEAPSDRRLHKNMPPVLAEEWQGYYQRFVEQYKLGQIEDKPPPEGQQDRRVQLALAERNFILSQDETVKWLLEGTKKVKRPHFKGPAAEAELTTPQRLQEYRNKVEEVNRIQSQEMTLFGAKLTPMLKKAQQEEAVLRKELTDDLNAQTDKMKLGLRDVLTFEQKRMDLPPEPAKPETAWSRFGIASLKWIDRIVQYGLLATGVCLILGLFTRTACLVGSLFLLMFYAAMPPLGLSAGGPPSEGHFLIINNNIIEILALFTIAVSLPYQRYGIDAWLHPMIMFLWRQIVGPKATAKEKQSRKVEPAGLTSSPIPVESPNGGVAAGV